MRVLIAEDNPAIAQAYRKCLPRHDIEILDIAGNGQEAVELYRRHADRIDIFLCDNKMPKMSGFEAVLQILEFAPDAIIIMVTGDEIDREQSRLYGIREVLRKPINMDRLIDTLFAVLDDLRESDPAWAMDKYDV